MANTDTSAKRKPRVEKTNTTWLRESNGSLVPMLGDGGKPVEDPTGAVAFDIEVIGLGTLRVHPDQDYPAEVVTNLKLFGAKQRFTNAIGSLDPDEAWDKINSIHESQALGNWRADTGPRVSGLVDAIIRSITNQGRQTTKSPSEIREAVLSWPEAKRADFAKRPEIAKAMEELRRERFDERMAKLGETSAPAGDDELANF